MKISNANLKIISDSRKQNTLEATLEAANISVKASVPSGKSKGKHEAFVLETEKAIKKFEEIKPQILAVSASGQINSQEEFDNFLISLDGAPNKENLGANLILALSLAFARLMAKSQNLELYEYIAKNSKLKTQDSKSIRPIFNVINGGAHATNPQSKLNFQEFQIIPEVKDFGMAYGLGKEFYEKLKFFLEKKFGKENIMLGDEAGFSAPFETNQEALGILAELISKHNYPLRIGLDVAATQFYQRSTANGQRQGHYLIDGEKYSADELKELYLNLIESYNILSIEDPFYEESFDMFASLTAELRGKIQRYSASGLRESAMIITDDLTTTNPQRLRTAIDKKAGNTILIKPNQIGTLTETLNVVKLAYENNWQAAVSHRSGETMDDFIADLAVAVNAWGLKAGAPAAPERMVKYERVLKIQGTK